MRRLLFIPLLLLALSGYGQIIRANSFYVAPAVAAAGYYADYQPIYDTLVAWGVTPHDTVADIQNDFVYELDTAGVWDELDGLYVFAAEDSLAGLLEWSSLAFARKLTLHGVVTFDQFEGFTGGGTNGADYGDTHWDPSNNGVHFIRNDAFVATYTRTSINENSGFVGSRSTGTQGTIHSSRYGGNSLWQVNSADCDLAGSINTPGFTASDRDAANNCDFYSNGTKYADGTQASVVVASADWHIFGWNNNGTSANNGITEISIVMWGGSLGVTKQAYLNTIVERFMDRLYKGIQ
jgi:hypothetical protein